MRSIHPPVASSREVRDAFERRPRPSPMARGMNECDFTSETTDDECFARLVSSRRTRDAHHAVRYLAANAMRTTRMGRMTAMKLMPPPPAFCATSPEPTPPANSSM